MNSLARSYCAGEQPVLLSDHTSLGGLKDG